MNKSALLGGLVLLAASAWAQDEPFQRIVIKSGERSGYGSALSVDPDQKIAAYLSNRGDLVESGLPGLRLFVHRFKSSTPIAAVNLPSTNNSYPAPQPLVSTDATGVYLLQDQVYRFDIATKKWSPVGTLAYKNAIYPYGQGQNYTLLRATRGHVFYTTPYGELFDLNESTHASTRVVSSAVQGYFARAVDEDGTRALLQSKDDRNGMGTWKLVSLSNLATLGTFTADEKIDLNDDHDYDTRVTFSTNARWLWVNHISKSYFWDEPWQYRASFVDLATGGQPVVLQGYNGASATGSTCIAGMAPEDGSPALLVNSLTGEVVAPAAGAGVLAPDGHTMLVATDSYSGSDLLWRDLLADRSLLYTRPRRPFGYGFESPTLNASENGRVLIVESSRQAYKVDLKFGNYHPFETAAPVRDVSPTGRFVFDGGVLDTSYSGGTKSAAYRKFAGTGETISGFRFLDDDKAVFAARKSSGSITIEKLDLGTMNRTVMATFEGAFAYGFDAVASVAGFVGTDRTHSARTLFVVDMATGQVRSKALSELIYPEDMVFASDGRTVQVRARFSDARPSAIYRVSDLSFRRSAPYGLMSRDGKWIYNTGGSTSPSTATATYLPTSLTIPLLRELDESIVVGPKFPALTASSSSQDIYMAAPAVPTRPILQATAYPRRGGGYAYEGTIVPAGLDPVEAWIEARTDGGSWQRLSALSGTYPATDGTHHLEFRAVDALGRISDTVETWATSDSVRPGIGNPQNPVRGDSTARLIGEGEMYFYYAIQNIKYGTSIGRIRVFPRSDGLCHEPYLTSTGGDYEMSFRWEAYDEAGNFTTTRTFKKG